MNAMFEQKKGEDFVRNNIEPKSNADRIRNMTDEELARFLHLFYDCDCCRVEICNEGTCDIGCEAGVLGWLKSEAKE